MCHQSIFSGLDNISKETWAAGNCWYNLATAAKKANDEKYRGGPNVVIFYKAVSKMIRYGSEHLTISPSLTWGVHDIHKRHKYKFRELTED